jgi:hypothetical protein
MTAWKYNNLGFRVFFALAIIVHVVFILVPVTKRMVATVSEQRSVQIQLVSPTQIVEVEQPPEPEPPIKWREPISPTLEELPPAPSAEPPAPVRAIAVQAAIPSGARMLSSQFDYENTRKKSLFGSEKRTEDSSDYYVRQRTSLEMALNQPSLQLPFEDTRIYLVDSYDAGFMGGMDKFWDTVSVPFGFTTKNNTRVQCVWVLVIAGCGWGHKTLFHRPARHREKPKEQGSKEFIWASEGKAKTAESGQSG